MTAGDPRVIERHCMEDIKSLSPEELQAYCESIGEKKFRAAQIYEWLHKKLATEWD